MQLRRLCTADPGFDAAFGELVAVETQDDRAIEKAATTIVDEVHARGDEALLEFTQRFDQFPVQAAAELEIGPGQLRAALEAIAPDDRAALEAAAKRIRDFHERQRESTWTFTEPDGTVLGQRITPLASVGVYVPGGLAAYPSSVLMNVIPAHVAGVENIVMVSPTPHGQRNPYVLAAAALAGVSRVFAIGGAQAVAALAYGTQTVPCVDKIVGPGNAYVAAAKRRVFGVVGIDMIAGPSEILIICDGQTDPDWIAFDLFSQAEHDERAQAILLTPDAGFIDQVQTSIERLLPAQPRRRIIEAALANKGALILTRSLEEACELASRIAPEHLEISTDEPQKWADRIAHAGALFLGRHCSEALGDYCAGPNHVLPTARTARFSSPLGVYDFVRRSSIIQVSPQGANTLGAITMQLAQAEGLAAHAASAQVRRQPKV